MASLCRRKRRQAIAPVKAAALPGRRQPVQALPEVLVTAVIGCPLSSSPLLIIPDTRVKNSVGNVGQDLRQDDGDRQQDATMPITTAPSERSK
jgi:hypothetical protein